jgi:hypothetical protein
MAQQSNRLFRSASNIVGIVEHASHEKELARLADAQRQVHGAARDVVGQVRGSE